MLGVLMPAPLPDDEDPEEDPPLDPDDEPPPPPPDGRETAVPLPAFPPEGREPACSPGELEGRDSCARAGTAPTANTAAAR